MLDRLLALDRVADVVELLVGCNLDGAQRHPGMLAPDFASAQSGLRLLHLLRGQ
jgi:hypothetical protein